MTRPILVLRPQPGAEVTVERARARGLQALVSPLFGIAARAWDMPEVQVDALLFTSANAARMLDARLDRTLRAYAVGAATASALHQAGFGAVVAGGGGVEEVLRRARTDGVTSLLHLAGENRTGFDPHGIRVETRIVYASEPVAPDPGFGAALDLGAVALLHSARAARRFRQLAGNGHRIAAISPAVRAAAGPGWTATAVADRPDDDALLAAAARLCQ